MSNQPKMLDRREWEEFRDSGMLWWANRILHVFGWAIVIEVSDNSGKVNKAYPARTRFRGFGPKQEAEGFERVSQFMAENAEELQEEARE